MPRCLECEREVEAGIIFCPECGGEVAAPTPAAGDAAEGTAGPDGEILRPDPDVDGSVSGEATAAAASGRSDDAADGEPADERPPETDVEGDSPFETDPLSVALGYPTRRNTTPLLYGFLANGLGTLFPPLRLLTWGHGFRLARATARGQTEPPAFDDFGETFVDGLRAFAVVGAYAAVVGVAWILAVTLPRVLGISGTATAAGLVGLAALYALPASLTAAAATGSLSAAVSGEHVVPFLTSAPYAKAFLLWLAILVGTFSLALVALFTVVGGFLVSAWGTYASGAVWGYYYRQAVARGVVPAPPAEPV